jgi:Mn2+/Fe2+ NRAMP family transporter
MIHPESRPTRWLVRRTDTPRCGSHCSHSRSCPQCSSCARGWGWLRAGVWQQRCATTTRDGCCGERARSLSWQTSLTLEPILVAWQRRRSSSPVFGRRSGFSLYALLILGMLIWTSYKVIAQIFKWMTLVLFAYVLTSFFAHVDWKQALVVTLVPHLEWSRGFLAVLVGILGTTISPYLFFWQAAEEVEEDEAKGKTTVAQRKGATAKELKDARTDTVIGMFFSNFIMYFIILTTGATLHAHGQTSILTAKEAAEALRPLAGDGAYLLFTLGLIGTGMLGVPVLVGSSAYAIAEGANWRGSMSDRPKKARAFYGVMAVAMVLGLALNYLGLNAVKMLFWSAVINGLLAPPLILLVILLTSSHKVMGKHVNSRVLGILGWATFVVMTAAAAGMLITS